MPPVARNASGGLQTARSYDAKPSKREQILGALNRINEKSTQKVAADELKAIISELDAEHTTVLVAALCNTGGDHKPFARKECLVALTQMVSVECPMQSVVMGPPHFNRILGHIKKMMQDSESSVRDACSTFLESAMSYLATASESLLPGSLSQPVIKLIFDVMNEQKKEAQCGAASALRAVAPFIGPLDKDIVKEMMRMMRNNAFQATHLLLNAIASPNPRTMQIHGLLATGADAFLPNLSKILGPAPPAGSGTATGSNGSSANSASVPAGILPCLQRADWQVRKAAADCLNAMALLLGTQMEPAGVWERYNPDSLTGRCLAALDTVKFDRVKLVRDAVQDACATLQELQSHGAAGGSLEAWRQAVDLASPLHKASQPPSPTGSDKHRGSSAGAVRQSSLHERFVRAHTGGEVVLESPGKQRPLSAMAPPLRRSSKSDAGGIEESGSRRAPVRMSAPVLQNRRNTKALAASREASESVEVLEVRASVDGSVASIDQVDNSISDLVNASRASDLPEAASPPREVVPQLQAEPSSSGRGDYVQVPVAKWEETLSRLQALEDLVPALVSKVAGLPALEERVACLEALGQAVAGVRAWQDGHAQQHFLEQDTTNTTQDKLAQRVSALEAQATAVSSSLPQLPQLAHGPPPRPPPLSTSLDAGLQSLGFTNGEPPFSTSPSPTLPQRTPSRYRLALSSPGSLHQSSEEPIVLAESELDNVFAEAVKGKEVDLLRLMGRTQPAVVWQNLSPDTALALLDSVAGLLERGIRTAMMLQWLWRVADEEQVMPCDVPLVLRMRVVNAIASMPQSDDAWGTEKGQLLLGTLLQVWELPDPIAAGSVQRRSSSSRRGLINSYELRSASASPVPVVR